MFYYNDVLTTDHNGTKQIYINSSIYETRHNLIENVQGNQNLETITHLYWDCPASVELWNSLTMDFNKKYSVNTQKSATRMLLGLAGDNGEKNHSVPDVLCTLTTHYIHVSKCTENARSPLRLWRHIRRTIDLENKIAISNNTLSDHKRKWDKFANAQSKKRSKCIFGCTSR